MTVRRLQQYYFRKLLHSACLIPFLLLIQISTSSLIMAQGFSAEVFAGTAWNIPTSLRIEQSGEEPLHFKAHYRTRPWKGSPYYAYRLGYDKWEAELIHHKLYLQNPPPEVQHFEVSHGYNLAMINYTQPVDGFTIRFGIGLVIAHPEGTIRGRSVGPVKSLLGGGYHVGGITAQFAISRELYFSNHFFITPEFKFTASWARVPLADNGQVKVPNLALHALTGIGYRSEEK